MKKLSLRPKNPWWALNEIQVLTVLVLTVVFLYLGALTIRTYREADTTGKPLPYLNSINVIGKGVVRVTPTIARVSAGVETTAPTVSETQKMNTEKMNEFIQKMRALGIPDADRTTTLYTIAPKYEYQQEAKTAPAKQVLLGYTLNQTVEMKIRRPEDLGKVLESIGQTGLNQIGSLQFIVDDEDSLKKQALARAITDAREKAAILAQTSGTRLGKLTAFYENQDYQALSSMETRERIPNADSVPLPQSGTQDITVSVTLSYEIK